jgi:hypothetical protein
MREQSDGHPVPLTTAELIELLREMDPSGRAFVVKPRDENPGADGDPEAVLSPGLGLMRRDLCGYWEWCGTGAADGFAVVVL